MKHQPPSNHPAQEKWNSRYSRETEAEQQRLPSPFVQDCLAQLPHHGHALDIAAGSGRHTVLLGQRGWQVDAVDISWLGLRLIEQRLAVAGLAPQSVNLIVADVERPWLPQRAYDAILVTYFLCRPLFPLIQARLRPGGYLIYETFLASPENKDIRANFQLQPDELPQAFSELEIIEYHEARDRHKATAHLLARKGSV